MRSALVAVLLFVGLAVQADPDSRYEFRAAHDADGIGKFYLGREIARVMGPGGIPWLERPERASEEQPQRMIEALEIRPGQTIADLGAGSGYYSFRIAPLVGPTGKVLAIDIEPAMLDAIAGRARREHVSNITTVRSSAQDPKLAPHSVDLLFMVDVYHELEYPYEVMTRVRAALKPGGRVALIEYRAEAPEVLIKPLHKMSEQQVRREMQAAGFEHVETVRTLPLQHLILFESGPVPPR
ncbi:MAG TPA: class I SAM-dependent methyltransferase [Steroidobacteraceae bacterium]|nr:class I SAM-dependent methyltransferase [Steroidobacteraceae bacterium]